MTTTLTRARTARFCTESVPQADRVPLWEEHNAQALVGLSCTAFADSGLRATQQNLDLDGLRVAEIWGNEHVIERSPDLVRTRPKEAVFVSLLLTGEAFFYHPAGCLTVRAGDMVLYEADRPYMFGFSGPMRQVMLDLPHELFTQRCVPGGVPHPTVVRSAEAGSAGVGTLSAAVLRAMYHAPADDQASTAVDSARTRMLDLLHVAAMGGASRPGAGHLLVAKEFIRRNLHDAGLTPARVARAVGVSERHLNRVFAGEDASVARYLLRSRLDRAYTELASAGRSRPRIGDVALRAGFTSQAHFTRVFKNRFAATPSQVRAS